MKSSRFVDVEIPGFCVLSLVILMSGCTGPHITHGPVLGRPGSDKMTVWVRTSSPTGFRVRYGTHPDRLNQVSGEAVTKLAHDNCGVVPLTDLKPKTRYFYQVDTVPPSAKQRSGSFRTLPDAASFRHDVHNPRGLFNFQFEFGCGNNQRHAGELKVPLKTYETMNRLHLNDTDFAILNGDWLYEEKREFTVAQWQAQTRTPDHAVPDILKLSPAVAGVWENYKLYWDRAPHVRRWHAHVPSFFTVDDHEIINDVYGTATPGFQDRRAVFRDPAIRAWYDYLAWSNPQAFDRPAHYGRSTLIEGADVLVDPDTDFKAIPLDEMANLHVHFGGESAGVLRPEPDVALGNPNFGVYQITEVIDNHRVRISPPARASGPCVYSIGRRTYGKFRIANCEFYLLDTRSHRDLHDVTQPNDPQRSMLGKRQLDWLLTSMDQSDADFFFVVSTVNFMVPHIGSGAANLDPGRSAAKDDAWTVFLHEREKLIKHWTNKTRKPVFVLTGDLHTSFAIKVTDNVWEFASGPHNSPNHRSEIDAGGLPTQGRFQYGPRACEVRWSSHTLSDIPRKHRRFPTYCVVQVVNVFDNAKSPADPRWVAYPRPYVIFKYHDGRDGSLKYAETIQLQASR